MTNALIFDAVGVVMALFVLLYLIILRLNRKSIMSKYEKGTPAHDMYNKLLNPTYLFVATILTLFFIFNLWSDLKANSTTVGGDYQIFVILSVVVLFSVIFLATFNKFKKK